MRLKLPPVSHAKTTQCHIATCCRQNTSQMTEIMKLPSQFPPFYIHENKKEIKVETNKKNQ